MIFDFWFSNEYDLSLLSIKCRVLDWCRAFARLVSVDAHLWLDGPVRQPYELVDFNPPSKGL